MSSSLVFLLALLPIGCLAQGNFPDPYEYPGAQPGFPYPAPGPYPPPPTAPSASNFGPPAVRPSVVQQPLSNEFSPPAAAAAAVAAAAAAVAASTVEPAVVGDFLPPNIPGIVREARESCPEGFSITADKLVCEKVEKRDMVESSCPPEYIVFEKRCAKFTDLHAECPEGTKLEEKSCVKRTLEEAVATCPEGALISGSSCTVVKLTPPRCPAGTDVGLLPQSLPREDDKPFCGREVPSIEQCPEEFSPQGKRCIRTYKPDPECPEGASVSSDGLTCEVPLVIPSECPMGYARISESECRRVVKAVFSPCPGQMYGARQDDPFCLVTTRHPPTYVCPEGYSLEARSQSCVQRVPQPPVCPMGSSPHSSIVGMCVKSSPSQKSCPANFELVADRCRRVTRTSPVAECPAGAVYDEETQKCAVVAVTESKAGCPQSFHEVDGRCVRTTLRPADILCGEGYVLSVQMGEQSPNPYRKLYPEDSTPLGLVFLCSKTVARMCETTIEQEDCSGVRRRLRHVRDLQADEFATEAVSASNEEGGDVKSAEGIRLKKPYAKAVPFPKLEGAVPQPPIAVIAPVGKRCPMKSVTIKKECPGEEYDVPRLSPCPAGSRGLNGGTLCEVEEETTKSAAVCPSGTSPTADGRCLHKTLQPAHLSCPGAAPGTSDCVAVEYTAPSAFCPVGFEVATPELVEALPVVFAHPNDCVKFEKAVDVPPMVIAAKASPICRTGQLKNLYCEDTRREPRGASCPSGYEKTEVDSSIACSRCIPLPPPRRDTRRVEAQFLCDDGEGVGPIGRCAEVTERRDLICPSSAVAHEVAGHVRCIRLVAAIPGHQRVTHVPAKFSCPKGRRVGGEESYGVKDRRPPLCEFVESNAAKFRCPPEYVPTVVERPGEVTGCAKFLPLQKGCPQGFEIANGDECIRRQQTPPTLTFVYTCVKGRPGCGDFGHLVQ